MKVKERVRDGKGSRFPHSSVKSLVVVWGAIVENPSEMVGGAGQGRF